jgi:branched-chain amino acid transport system ATP-binding protein
LEVAVLLTNEIVCAYLRDIEIVKGVSLTIRPGLITAIIGPNGVGKSTLLKGIYGSIKAQSGRIEADGVDLSGAPMAARFKAGIRYLPQDSSVFPYMTVQENLKLFAWADNVNFEQLRHSVFATFPDLQEKYHTKAGDLSGGQRKQLEFSRFLCGKTKYALVDEPSVGLSPSMCSTIYSFLKRMRDDGVGILLVDQQVASAIDIANHVYVVDGGKVIEEGSGEQFRNNLGAVVSKWLMH